MVAGVGKEDFHYHKQMNSTLGVALRNQCSRCGNALPDAGEIVNVHMFVARSLILVGAIISWKNYLAAGLFEVTKFSHSVISPRRPACLSTVSQLVPRLRPA